MPRIPLVAVTAAVDAPVDDTTGAPRVRLSAAYLDALVATGLAPLVVSHVADAAHAARILESIDGLVLSGGGDVDPAHYGRPRHRATGPADSVRDAAELALVDAARARGTPVLAICRGLQLLNVALGGTLVQDLASERSGGDDHARSRLDGRVHDVVPVPETRLAAAVGTAPLRVNSRHHQAIDELAPGVRVSARAADGVIEGLETAPDDAWWVLAVQWHPEDLARDPDGPDARIFAAFAERLRLAPGR